MKTKTPYVKPLRLFIFLLLTSFIGSADSFAQRKNIIFESTGEETNAVKKWPVVGGCCSYSIQQSADVSRAGKYSLRFEVNKTDNLFANGRRAEVNLLSSDKMPFERWYGMSYFIPNDYIIDQPNLFESVNQWHDAGSAGETELKSPFDFIIDNGRWGLDIRWATSRTATSASELKVDLAPIKIGAWTDFVYHIKFSTGSDGLVEIWKDGTKVYTRNGPIGFNHAVAPFFKMGIYKWPWNPQDMACCGNTNSTKKVIYIDEFRLGDANATYNDVAPTAISAPVNQAPMAKAGNDMTLTLPTILTTLDGSKSYDPDGSITSYKWARIGGPTIFSLLDPAGITTSLLNLIQGTYSFKLTVTDNSGATSSDTVVIDVKPLISLPTPNKPPVANAGSGITLTLPGNSTTLNGSGSTDPDGRITDYSWTKTSGPSSYSLSAPTSATTTISNLAEGTYTFKLTVTDNSDASSSSTVTIIVNPAPAVPNQAPVANAGSSINVTLPVNSATLDGSGSSDRDGVISLYKWTRVSGPTSYAFDNSAAASTAVNNLIEGVYKFKLTVTDDDGATASSTVNVTVNAAPPPPNQAPVANAGSEITLTLPVNSATLDGSRSNDPDGSISTYAWTRISGPTSYTLANADAVSTGVAHLVEGTYKFRLTITDNDGATASSTVTVIVNAAPPPPNQAPVANAGSDITLTLPVNSTTLDGSGSRDADGSIDDYAWTRISGPTSYTLANADAISTGVGNLAGGTYKFRLTVTDNNGATASSTVTVIVNAATGPDPAGPDPTGPVPPANQAPVANAGNNIIITLPVNSATLNGSGSKDADGSISKYGWTKTNGPASYTLATPGAVSTGVGSLVQGTYTFNLIVTDNGGKTASSIVTITVNAAIPPPNQAPVANAGSNIVMTLPVNSATLNGSGSRDPDGSIGIYAWTRTNGPTTYNLASPGAVSTGLNNLVQGVYTFKLTVTDNKGVTASSTVTVTVNAAPPPPNQAPIANAGSNIVITLATNSATLNGSASRDPDGSISKYAWTRVGGPTSYTLATPGSASTVVSNLTQGVYTFQLTVTDNRGATASSNVTVTVNPAPTPANQAPIAKAGTDITITLPTKSATLNGSGSTDPEGSALTYAWTRISGPATYTFVNANGVTTVVNNLTQGTYKFQLTVKDNKGAIGVATVNVTVKPAATTPPPATPIINQAPIAKAGDDMVVMLPVDNVSLNGGASTDADGRIVGYEWTELSGPATAVMSNKRSTVSTISGLMIGEYIFELKVTDDKGASSKQTIKVVVRTKNGEKLDLILYPNPVSYNLTIQYSENLTGKMKIIIFDANKRLIRQQDVTKDLVTFTEVIDVSRLKSGAYFLQIIRPDNKRIAKTFIKM